MRTCVLACSVVVLAGLAGFAEPLLAPNPGEVSADEKVLREARVGTDGPGLLEFFRKRTLTEADRQKVGVLIRKLGDDSYEMREQASSDLQGLGKVAIPLLTRAAVDPDPEVARRASECLQNLKEGGERTLVLAAARLLGERKPAGAAAALLGYLPFAIDELAAEEVTATLERLACADGKIDPVLPAALTDRESARRATAGRLLARHSPTHRAQVRRLLADVSPDVRFEVALGLAQSGEKQAIEPLVELFPVVAPEQAWQIEDLLFRLAGDQAVTVSLSSGFEEENRRRCRDAWQQWWRDNRDKVDLARLSQNEQEVGDRVVCELQGGAEGGGRVFAFGADDRVRWQFDNVAGPIDVQLQRNGRMLLAEINSNRVTERDRGGKIHFEKRLDNSPVSAQRLSNGNIFIATYTELLEVAPDGRTVASFRKSEQRIYCAQKLRNGHILYVTSGGLVIELDQDGREVRSVPAGDTSNWGSVELLSNGHFLVCRCSRHEVVEIDPAGKVVWSHKSEWPTWACQRRNGHVLVACAHTGLLLEVNREGKEVWKQQLSGRPCRVRRY